MEKESKRNKSNKQKRSRKKPKSVSPSADISIESTETKIASISSSVVKIQKKHVSIHPTKSKKNIPTTDTDSEYSTFSENTTDMSNDESLKSDANVTKRKQRLKELQRSRGQNLLRKIGKDEEDEIYERQIDKFFVMSKVQFEDQDIPLTPQRKSRMKQRKMIARGSLTESESSGISFGTQDSSMTNSFLAHNPMREVSGNLVNQPEVNQRIKSSRCRNYRHFVEAEQIFQNGYGSSCSSDSIVSPESISDGKKPDMSWVLDDNHPEPDLTQVCERTHRSVYQQVHEDYHRNEFFESLQIILWTLKLLGRIPFVIYVDQETGTLHCRMYTGIKKFAFVLINILLSLILIASLLSVLTILFKSSEHSTAFENFEKLLLEKHWLHMIHFQCFLLLAVIEAVAESRSHKFEHYINDWGLSLQSLKYDASDGIRLFGYVNLLATAIDILIFYPLVYTKTCGRHESNKFITVLIFRWVIPDSNAYYTKYADVLQHVVLFIQIYAVFAARSTLCFVLSYCRGITNVAHHWNLRIALMLNKIIPTPDEDDLISLKKSLTYRKMLEDHFTITKLLRRTSNSFMVIFVAFFCIEIITIICEMFKIATVFLFDLRDSTKFNSTTVQNSDVKYESTYEEISFEIVYFITSTVLLFNTVSLITSSVGETIMGGFHSIRRYGLMCATGVKERKFIMSLTNSFNGKNPYVLNPGSLFNIDRSIVLSVLAAACLIFSIMIQCKVVNLVQVSIILPCNDGKLCIGTADQNQAGEPPIDPIQTPPPILTTSMPTTTLKTTLKTTTTPITTTEPTTTLENTTTPTTTTTTTTTARPPGPECKPADTSKGPWVQKNADLRTKLASCGAYCRLTGIYRMVPRDDMGKKKDLPWIDKTDEKEILNCIVNPYEKIPTNSKIYDCFGNCYKTRDDCGHYGFSLGEPLKMHKVDEKATGGYKGMCFHPVTEEERKFGNPLEICGLPYAIVNIVCTGTGPPPGLDLNTLFVSKTVHDLIWDASLLKRPLKPRCDAKTTDKDFTKDFELSNTMLVPKRARGITVIKLKTFSYLHNPAGEIVPFDKEHIDFKTAFGYNPYTYIHPKFMKSDDNKKAFTFGMYDCFGNPVKIFDTCGGLNFTMVGIKTPILENVQGAKDSHICWQNAFGMDYYKCGGVGVHPLEDVDVVCKKYSTAIG